MPVPRVCAHCRKTLLASTYEMFEHVKKCAPKYDVNKSIVSKPLFKPKPPKPKV